MEKTRAIAQALGKSSESDMAVLGETVDETSFARQHARLLPSDHKDLRRAAEDEISLFLNVEKISPKIVSAKPLLESLKQARSRLHEAEDQDGVTFRQMDDIRMHAGFARARLAGTFYYDKADILRRFSASEATTVAEYEAAHREYIQAKWDWNRLYKQAISAVMQLLNHG
jgi:hypothetical protein